MYDYFVKRFQNYYQNKSINDQLKNLGFSYILKAIRVQLNIAIGMKMTLSLFITFKTFIHANISFSRAKYVLMQKGMLNIVQFKKKLT